MGVLMGSADRARMGSPSESEVARAMALYFQFRDGAGVFVSPCAPWPHASRPSCALELQSLLYLSAIVLRPCPPEPSGV
jgi:hypothetical protein